MRRLWFAVVVVLVGAAPVLAVEDPNSPSWTSQVISSGFQWAWRAICNLVYGIIDSVLGLFMSVIPENWYPHLGDIMHYVDLANTWLPLDLGLSLLSAYYAFILMLVVVRWVLKFIPFIG